MQFVYPQFLWALLALIIPIVIHLFNFKRYKTLYFSSLSFVKHVDQKTKSTKSLKHYLILASRLLTFIFLILAFAQPYFPKEGGEQSLNSIFSIYLDNSFSMEAKGTEGELLAQAREKARDLIKKSSLDTRFIVASNNLSGNEKRILTKIEALEKIDNISFSPLSRDLSDIIEWQTAVFESNNLNAEANIQSVLLSDFQHLRNKNNIDSLNIDKAAFYPLKLNPAKTDNIYIDSLWFSSPIHKLGLNKELNIRLKNNGEENISNCEVLINIGKFKKTLFVDVPRKSAKTTQINYQDKTTGKKEGVVQVIDNNLFFDNNYFFSYDVKDRVNVLIIQGEDAIPNIKLVLELDKYFNTESKNITSIIKNDFQEKDLVIINGGNDISNGMSTFLSDFYETGGSIALFPGKTPNKFNWNRLLQIFKLPTIGQRVSSGTRISKIQYSDNFYKGVFEKQTQKLNLPSVTTVFKSVISNNSMASPLITLQNNLPLFSKVENKGTAYMFYSSLHPDYGNFSKDALFSTIILRASELSQRKQPEYIIIGDQSKFPIYDKIDENNPIHIKNESVDFIPRSESSSGVHYISLKNKDVIDQLKAGNYSLETDKRIGTISLNYNRNESKLNSNSRENIVARLKELGAMNIHFNEIGQDSTLSSVDINKPFSYWKLCIIFTLIFVLVEMLLIRLLK